VPSAAAEKFVKMAEDVAASRGAIQALAAAIAVISGNDKPRSLLTATPVSGLIECYADFGCVLLLLLNHTASTKYKKYTTKYKIPKTYSAIKSTF